MVWFRVDDNLALHPKVIEAGNAAMGLWVRAGAWSAANLTDGFIPTRVALRLGSRNLCYRLVAAGLFDAKNDGFQFHGWDEKNFTKDQVETRREQDRKRQADHRRRHLSAVGNDLDVTPLPDASQPSPLEAGLVSNGHQPAQPRRRRPPPAAASERPPPKLCPLHCEERGGYRENGTVCDHIDHEAETVNGRAATREVLAKIQNRKAAR
jgi:hypothetical protein